MNHPDWNAWIAHATAPFPEETAGRLRAEYLGHLEAARDDLADAGHAQPEEEALRRLGPAELTRHALERTHFTADELDALRSDPWFGRIRAGTWRDLSMAVPVLALWPLLFLATGFFASRTFHWDAYFVYLGAVALYVWLELWSLQHLPALSRRILQAALRPLLAAVPILTASFIFRPSEVEQLAAELFAKLLGLAIGLTLTFPRPALRLLAKAWRGAR